MILYQILIVDESIIFFSLTDGFDKSRIMASIVFLCVHCCPAVPLITYSISCSKSFSFLPFLVMKDLKYADTHEWVKVEGDSATVGITDHAQVDTFI